MAFKTIEMIRLIRDAMREETKGMDAGELVAYYSAEAGVGSRRPSRQGAGEVRDGSPPDS